ncbi:MAG: peptidase S41, partial [Bacteroidota bacterium]
MRLSLFILCCCTALALSAQDTPPNLDFESGKEGDLPGWSNFGGDGYTVSSVDEAYGGTKAGFINTTTGSGDYKALAYNIPARYEGKQLKLTGWVKTKDVTDGYAGLWLRLDPQVGFDNMADRGLTGTNDWQRLEIEMELKPSQTKAIVLGCLLVGKGQVWVDDLELTIDGKPYDQAPAKKLPLAQLDKEFDAGSGVVFPELTPALIEDLTFLGKV